MHRSARQKIPLLFCEKDEFFSIFPSKVNFLDRQFGRLQSESGFCLIGLIVLAPLFQPLQWKEGLFSMHFRLTFISPEQKRSLLVYSSVEWIDEIDCKACGPMPCYRVTPRFRRGWRRRKNPLRERKKAMEEIQPLDLLFPPHTCMEKNRRRKEERLISPSLNPHPAKKLSDFSPPQSRKSSSVWKSFSYFRPIYNVPYVRLRGYD